jgi:hypothetical protein
MKKPSNVYENFYKIPWKIPWVDGTIFARVRTSEFAEQC